MQMLTLMFMVLIPSMNDPRHRRHLQLSVERHFIKNKQCRIAQVVEPTNPGYRDRMVIAVEGEEVRIRPQCLRILDLPLKLRVSLSLQIRPTNLQTARP